MNPNSPRPRRWLAASLAVALSFGLLGPVGATQAAAARPSAATTAVTAGTGTTTADAAVNGWSLDPATVQGGETLEAGSGAYVSWTHFKSTAANGNAAGNPTADNQYPAIAVYDGTFDFTKPGSLHATIVSPQEATKNRFGFYLGYRGPGDGLFIGYDTEGWFWQKYAGGDGEWLSGTRTAAPGAGVKADVDITWTGTTATLSVDGAKAFDVDYAAMDNLSGTVAMKAGSLKETGDTTDMYIRDFPVADTSEYAVTGMVVDVDGKAVADATVSAGSLTARTGADGAFSLTGLRNGTYTLTVSKDGYEDATREVTVNGGDVTLDARITLNKAAEIETKTLSSADMDVRVRTAFPSVLDYTMKKLDGKVMHGQTKDVRTVAVNGTAIELTDDDVTFRKTGDAAAEYTLHAKDEAKGIDATITVVMAVKANTLSLEVTKVVNHMTDDKTTANVEEHAVETIAFPNQSLVAVRSDQSDPQFTGSVMSTDVSKVGDENLAVTTATSMTDRDYMYAFVSGGGLSAGLWSNSEHDGRTVQATVSGGSRNTRVYATTEKVAGATSLGLASAPWYWHRTVSDTNGARYTIDQEENPKLSVAIAGDENGDGAVNWQDGAIAYRSIMNNPYKADETPERVAWRIAMNFGSQAQNPFLTTLDNVKKVALSTDGLGQSVLLKGYGNEGHDSAHPDYGDINTRAGGAADMNTLMSEGAKYGARFGIHVNASEMYPEAKAFSEDMVNRSGGSLRYGWDWIDQAVGINGVYDLASGMREQRFATLKGKVGDGLDFVYVDIWGSGTSGDEDSWQTQRLVRTINGNGWAVGTEYGAALENDATFQHWSMDLGYGGAANKGQNSQVMRFLRNHQKDSWTGDWPSFGGAANAPLLGGYSMKDFEGWQGRNDYAAYIENLYTHDVSTKFIQHFKVTQWVNSPLDSTSVQDASINNGNEQITLKDDSGNTVVLKRGSNNTADAGYRDRTITLNGKVVASGSVEPGDGSGTGTESYLIPWLWDATTGKRVEADAEKLYHWNTVGGETTWTLPDDWANLKSVKVYQLTDQGKTDEKTVKVTDGKVTLTADAQTPYVVYRGAAKQIKVTWSTGMHVTDAGFNGGAATLKDNWTVAGSGKAEVIGDSNAVLRLTGSVKVSQRMTGLTAGKRYAVYLGVDNRTDGTAKVTVTDGSAVLAENHTGRSIAKNYVKAYAHNTNTVVENGVAGSYFQNMYVWFTAPDSGTATVTMSLADTSTTADAHAYFDDVRILENAYDGAQYNADGSLRKLSNGFEHNAQGLWPFVVSGSEGVEDNRIHLSELHAPFTQAGWETKRMDDVLDGKWSLKVHGLTQKNTLLVQTIPQNVRFEPGETYKVTFTYQSGSAGTYAIAVGDGEFDASRVKLTELGKALGETKTAEFEITGSSSGNSWFGLYSTSTAADTQGVGGYAANLGGYRDLIVDDVTVEHVASASHTKAEAEAKIKELRDTYDGRQAEYGAAAWRVYVNELAEIRALVDKDDAGDADYTAAYNHAVALLAYMADATGDASDDAWDVRRDGSDQLGGYTVSAGSAEATQGGASEGPAELAQDGDAQTRWHTGYSDNAIADGKAWYRFNLAKPTTINGMRYLPRPGAANANGKIKRYRIDLTLADGSTKTVVESGEFSTTTAWQKATFDPVDNVVAVTLTALQTAGQSTAQENRFVSAAELRITTNREVGTTPITVDKSSLQELVEEAGALNEGDYTADSWTTLTAKLAAARKVLDNADADAYDVALAAANLHTAIDGLQSRPDKDTTALRNAVDAAAALKESDYTTQSWSVFAAALAEAKRVLADPDATQADVDAALDALRKAVTGLEAAQTPDPDKPDPDKPDPDKPDPDKPDPDKPSASVDKSVLSATIAKAKAIDPSGYTAKSAAALRSAIAEAQTVLNDANATQSDVDAAVKQLDKAIAALRKANGGGDDQSGGLSKTGADVAVAVMSAMMLAAAGAALMLRRRRR
ncbi:endo-alpha-N-acetylgalactosaminidase family protein [Bifidobacterium leontopitheci]|uniref:Endo-alpha-N-acetylgalactosaminidase n=1 Tax=Bifidobacterium leontopitheci TaxID=2650774 RepID=A0A6I1GH38_9BIFI|nr:endo-alpha-N-acetylgalactosaminidase family protein [Bifidobacterium leontopitheci]KAB7790925.1 Endo-alpha-N-acetylgalactosaminidase [Bifidobacterium leontopitheci]